MDVCWVDVSWINKDSPSLSTSTRIRVSERRPFQGGEQTIPFLEGAHTVKALAALQVESNGHCAFQARRNYLLHSSDEFSCFQLDF